MATIPTDVIHTCIFPKLPVKSLTRFKSVSKTWQTIISSPEFIHLHHQHAVSSNDNRLIVFKKGLTFHIHELDSPLAPSLHWYYTELAPISIDILASSEFFLLINLYHDLGLILLNPSIGRYYKIPYPPSYGRKNECYGIYLDEYNHDYKVIRLIQKFCFRGLEDVIDINIEVMVYSLRTNKWRLIEQTLDKCYEWCSLTIVIGHLLHILLGLDTNAANVKRIGCFDILAEKWTNDVPMPQINVLGPVRLAVLDGLLCVSGVDMEETGSRKWCVWVMKEYGVKDSWFKLMSIASDDILYSDINPIAFHKGSPHEVLCRRISNFEFIWYNVREKKATTAATLNGVIPKAIFVGIDGYICKESLVDFPGGRNMERRQPKQAKQSMKLLGRPKTPFVSIDIL